MIACSISPKWMVRLWFLHELLCFRGVYFHTSPERSISPTFIRHTSLGLMQAARWTLTIVVTARCRKRFIGFEFIVISIIELPWTCSEMLICRNVTGRSLHCTSPETNNKLLFLCYRLDKLYHSRHCASLHSVCCNMGRKNKSRNGAQRNDGSFNPKQFLIRSNAESPHSNPHPRGEGTMVAGVPAKWGQFSVNGTVETIGCPLPTGWATTSASRMPLSSSSRPLLSA